MPAISAGLLLYCGHGPTLQVLLVHPGGPYWRKKDDGAWTIPKGEVEPGEDVLTAARREFAEETGFTPTGPFLPLGSVRQKSGKLVHAWAFSGEFDLATLRSNSFSMEWPPGSGRQQQFPEVDRAEYFEPGAARTKIIPAQAAFVDRLVTALDASPARRP